MSYPRQAGPQMRDRTPARAKHQLQYANTSVDRWGLHRTFLRCQCTWTLNTPGYTTVKAAEKEALRQFLDHSEAPA